MNTYPSWRSSRERVGYRERRPELTVLYRVVEQYHEELYARWDELFFERYGVLRDEVRDGLERYLSCGIVRHGAARLHCPSCNHSRLVAYSCKRRGVCPSCQAKRAVLFAEHLHEAVLLPYPHRHVIFSLPKRLRVFFRYDRSLFRELYRSAWESWCELVRESLPYGKTGAVLSLHTAGTLLQWHPHVHGLALGGVLLDDGHFLPLREIDLARLEQLFSEKVFSFLLERELLDADTVESMRSWEHSGFNVFVGEEVAADDDNARLFLARYLKKAPFSLSRLQLDESGDEPRVVYLRDEPGAAPTEDSSASEVLPEKREFKPLEFLAEVSAHVPLVYEQLTRWFGVYSPRTRGAKKRDERFRALVENNFEPLEYEEEKKKPSETWRRCMKLVFEIDPFICERCGSEMKIVAFINDPKELERIANHLGYPAQRAPPIPRGKSSDWVDAGPEFSQLN